MVSLINVVLPSIATIGFFLVVLQIDNRRTHRIIRDRICSKCKEPTLEFVNIIGGVMTYQCCNCKNKETVKAF